MSLGEDFIKNDQTSENDNPSLDEISTSYLVEIVNKYRVSIAFGIIGLISIGVGIFSFKIKNDTHSEDVVLLEDEEQHVQSNEKIYVEVAGAIQKPDVYELDDGARVEDLLVIAGGLSADADRVWVEKHVNRAALLSDSQKIYIPNIDEQIDNSSANAGTLYQNDTSVLSSEESNVVNINTASQSELEELWGIGPVYAQKIIEQRPYSSVEELLEKGVIKSNVYEHNKELMTAY